MCVFGLCGLRYSYTLYAVRGDEELGVQDARDQGTACDMQSAHDELTYPKRTHLLTFVPIDM